MASKICFASISWDMLVHRITLMFSFAKLTNGHISVVSGLQESTVLPILFQWALFLDAILVCTYFCSYFSFWWLDWFFFLPILFDKECKFYFRKAPIWQIFVQAIFKLRFLPIQNLNLNKPLVIQNFAFFKYLAHNI